MKEKLKRHGEVSVPFKGDSGDRQALLFRFAPVKEKAGARIPLTRPSQLACRAQTRNFRQSKLLHFPAFCLFNLFDGCPVSS